MTRGDLLSQFRDIVSDSSIFGKHVVLERLFEKHGLKKENTLYVGDEVRDVDACKKVGVEIITVAWGWNCVERLQETQSPIAHSVEELRELLLSRIISISP